MPVIPCPDCNRDVSTMAASCPHCGRPMGSAAAALQPPPPSTKPEETLWHGTPSGRILLGRAAALLLTPIVIMLLAYLIASMSMDLERKGQIVRAGWWIVGTLVFVQAIGVVVKLLQIRSTIYTITTQRILIEQGLLSKSVREIDLRTIDDTQFFQSLIQRALGIGNVTLVSTDKTMPTFVLHNIPDPRAMREQIRTHAYTMSQRQLYTRQA